MINIQSLKAKNPRGFLGANPESSEPPNQKKCFVRFLGFWPPNSLLTPITRSTKLDSPLSFGQNTSLLRLQISCYGSTQGTAIICLVNVLKKYLLIDHGIDFHF